MFQYLFNITKGRIKQLKEQESIDEKLQKLPCTNIILQLMLMERKKIRELGYEMYEHTEGIIPDVMGLYNATNKNLEWIESHQHKLTEILLNKNKQNICKNIKEYIDQN